MRRTLDALGRDIARLVDEDLRDIEEEGLGGGSGDDQGTQPVRIIPENIVLYMEEEKSISIQVRKDLDEADLERDVDPVGVVDFLDDDTQELKPHRQRENLSVASVRLRPLVENEEALLTVRYGNHKAVALIEVRPARIIEEEEIEPPDSLQFEQDAYRIAWLKTRKLQILAPAEVVATNGSEVKVVSSDDGVVVRGGAVELMYNDEFDYYEAEVSVETRRIGAKAILTAIVDEASTTCQVIVSRDEQGPALKIRIVDEEAGHRRALVEIGAEHTEIKIMGRHPAIERYLGPPPEFPHQEQSLSKALVAEIVAGEAARIVLERKFSMGAGAGLLDAANLYVEHSRYLTKYLQRCHKALVPEGGLATPEAQNRPSNGGTTKGGPDPSELQRGLSI